MWSHDNDSTLDKWKGRKGQTPCSLFYTGRLDKEVSGAQTQPVIQSPHSAPCMRLVSGGKDTFFYNLCKVYAKVSLILIGWPWPCPELPKPVAGERMGKQEEMSTEHKMRPT